MNPFIRIFNDFECKYELVSKLLLKDYQIFFARAHATMLEVDSIRVQV
jgi:hypothetical protein